MPFDPTQPFTVDDETEVKPAGSARAVKSVATFDPTQGFEVEEAPSASTLQGIANSAKKAWISGRQAGDLTRAERLYDWARRESDFYNLTQRLTDRPARGAGPTPMVAIDDQGEGVRFDPHGPDAQDSRAVARRMVTPLLENVARDERKLRALPDSKAMQDWNRADGAWDAARAFAKNPFEITANIATSGAVSSIKPMAQSVAGSLMAGAPGAAAGAAQGGFELEYAARFLKAFGDAGIDVADPQQLIAAFNDREMITAAKQAALKRGLTIAGFEALSGGLAGRLSIIKAPIKRTAAELATETALEGAGELAGQVAAGDKLSAKDVVEEMIGGAGMSAAQVTAGRLTDTETRDARERETDAAVREDLEARAGAGATRPKTSDGNEVVLENGVIEKRSGTEASPPAAEPPDFTSDEATLAESYRLQSDYARRLSEEPENEDLVRSAAQVEQTIGRLEKLDGVRPEIARELAQYREQRATSQPSSLTDSQPKTPSDEATAKEAAKQLGMEGQNRLASLIRARKTEAAERRMARNNPEAMQRKLAQKRATLTAELAKKRERAAANTLAAKDRMRLEAMQDTPWDKRSEEDLTWLADRGDEEAVDEIIRREQQGGLDRDPKEEFGEWIKQVGGIPHPDNEKNFGPGSGNMAAELRQIWESTEIQTKRKNRKTGQLHTVRRQPAKLWGKAKGGYRSLDSLARAAREAGFSWIETADDLIQTLGRRFGEGREVWPDYASVDVLPQGMAKEMEERGSEGRGLRFSGEGKGTEEGLSLREVHAALRPVRTQWANAPRIHVVDDVSGLPERNRRVIEAEGAEKEIEGFVDYDTGEVWMLAGNLESAERAQAVLRHEVVGHLGVSGLLGREWEPFLQSVASRYARRKEGKDIARTYRLDLDNAQDRLILGDEVIARLAEGGIEDPTLWQKVVQRVRELLARIGFDVDTLTETAIRETIANARRMIEGQGAQTASGARQATPAAASRQAESRSDRNQSNLFDEGALPFNLQGEQRRDSDVETRRELDRRESETETGQASLFETTEGTEGTESASSLQPELDALGRQGSALAAERERYAQMGERIPPDLNGKINDLRIQYRELQAKVNGTVPGLKQGKVVPWYPSGKPTPKQEGMRFSRKEQTETPAFKNWFGGSKVVDSNGAPLVVYHGTEADFEAFDGRFNRSEGGFFFTPDPTIANLYGNKMVPAYLSVQNPLIVDRRNDLRGRLEHIVRAVENGHDGVYFKNDYDAGGPQDQWVVFDPGQAKSAIGNRGTFDPADARMAYSRMRPTVAEHAVQSDSHSTEPLAERFVEGFKNLLKKFGSALPELQITGEKAREFLRFRQGYEKLQSANDWVRARAQKELEHILEPIRELGRDRIDAQAIKTYRETARQRKALQAKLEAMAPGRARVELAQRIREMDTRVDAAYEAIAENPWFLFQEAVLWRDLWFRTLLKNPQGEPITLPYGLSAEAVRRRLADIHTRIHEHGNREQIEETLRRHYTAMEALQESILERGHIIPEDLRNPLYFPHHVLDRFTGTAGRIKPVTEEDFRKYLMAPVGSKKGIETDYLTALYTHIADVRLHNAHQDIVAEYWQPYDISKERQAELEAEAQMQGRTLGKEAWKYNLPDGYKLYTVHDQLPLRPEYVLPRETIAEVLGKITGELTSQAKAGEIIQDGDLRQRLTEAGLALDVAPGQLVERLVAGEREQWLVPTEVADQLEALKRAENRRDRLGGTIERAAAWPLKAWKMTKLFAPWNYLRYEFNNTLADVEKLFSADPAVFRELPQAAKEVHRFLKTGEGGTDLKEAFRRGVIDSVTASEIESLKTFANFEAFMSDGERAKSWARKAATFTMPAARRREATFRYAKFMADLKRLRAGESPVYAGAYWRDVEALPSDYEKAEYISKKTFGYYPGISTAGNFLRRHVMPFYSWMEINLRYHVNLFRNFTDAARLGDWNEASQAASALRRSAVRMPLTLSRSAAVMATSRLMLVPAMFWMWNNGMGQAVMSALGFDWDEDDDLESTLSEHDRRRQHVILGKDENGKTMVVYMPTAFSDVTEWIAGENLKRVVGEVMRGETELDDGLESWLMEAPGDVFNKLIQSIGPQFKVPYIALSGKNPFPDAFDQRTVSKNDLGWILLEGMTDNTVGFFLRNLLDEEHYSSKSNLEWFQQAILQVRRRDPEAWAYYALREKADDYYEEQTGASREFAYDAPDAQAIRNFRKAIYRGDMQNAIRFYNILLGYGYTAERFQASIRAQNPLSGLRKDMRQPFIDSLSEHEREQLERAMRYYARMRAAKGHEKELFPTKTRPERWAGPRFGPLFDLIGQQEALSEYQLQEQAENLVFETTQ